LRSPYYPPRARWYGRFLCFGDGLRRRLALDRVRLPPGISFFGLVGSLLVPGLGFYVSGCRRLGQAAVAMCAVLSAVFFIWLGYPAGNWAFGLLLSIHSTALGHLVETWLPGERLRVRIACAAGILMALGWLIYLPLRM